MPRSNLPTAFEALGSKSRNSTAHFYLAYLYARCEFTGAYDVMLRDLDRAPWQRSSEQGSS